MESEKLVQAAGATRNRGWQFALLVAILFAASGATAQSMGFRTGEFLTPNQFTTTKELTSRALWLQAGYGREFIGSGNLRFGMEGLIWSRLRSLSDFRFPVETADYFFGAYEVWMNPLGPFRLRLSHISSHLVDGADSSIVGGSSSHYSREFVQVDQAIHREGPGIRYRASVGVRYIFHQVTNIEPAIVFPATFDLSLASFGKAPNERTLFLTLSDAAGPVGYCYEAALTYRTDFDMETSADLFLALLSGASKAGNDEGRTNTRLELGIRLAPHTGW